MSKVSSLIKKIGNKYNLFLLKLNKAIRVIKPSIKYEKLLSQLSSIGIKENDTVLIHSSLSKIGNVDGGALTIIKAFLNTVGSEGNIAMPTYSYVGSMSGTAKSENFIFLPKQTPSVVGIITETFRKTPNVKRSIHPTHSVCALGKDADYITNGHLNADTNFGPDTPFHRLRLLKGKIVGIGINRGPVTIYHTIEDFFLEEFKGVYLNQKFPIKVESNNEIVIKHISIHNPEFHKIRIDKNAEIEKWFTNYFRKKNMLHEGGFGDTTIWWMDIQKLYDELFLLKEQGITIYNIPKS
jgi:aminoglycoside 3-N-acetyltransferase